MMIVKDLQPFELVYLATPYTLYQEGLDAAYREACRITNILIVKGVRCFSPIAHGHALSTETGLSPGAIALWYWYNEGMLRKSDCLIVGCMNGWRESAGVEHEIKAFLAMRKPIYLLNPHTHEIVPWAASRQSPSANVDAKLSLG